MKVQSDLIRAGSLVMVAGIAGLTVQPIIAHPDVAPYLVLGAKALVCIGVTTAAGYGAHKLYEWRSLRLPMPVASPAPVYATTHAAQPAVEYQAAVAQHEARVIEHRGETGTERDYYNRVVRFCVIGTTRGSFGYRAMRPHVDRPGWDKLTKDLAESGVLVVGRGRTPTWFAEGWSCPRVRWELHQGSLPLPIPDPLPAVRW